MDTKVIGLINFARKLNRRNKLIAAGASLMLVVSVSVLALQASNSSVGQTHGTDNQSQDKTDAKETKAKAKPKKKKAKKTVVNKPASTPIVSKPAPVASTTPKVNRVLKISPSRITIKISKGTAPITIASTDGVGVNMPLMLGGLNLGTFNFDAGGPKPTWSGPFGLYPDVKPGTYTQKILAQDANAKEYWGTVTLVIVP